jgi:uncharacterized Zn-finger protein
MLLCLLKQPHYCAFKTPAVCCVWEGVQKFNLHMKMHTREKPYRCFVCGQQFIQKGSHEKHNTLHTVQWLYSCGLWGKTFRCTLDLNQYTKLHKVAAHMCSICGKVFTEHPNLDSHVQTHTGEKPYLCHTCGIPFTQKEAWTKHSRIPANDCPHQCSVCNKCFMTQSALNHHLGSHWWETILMCNMSEAFHWQGVLYVISYDIFWWKGLCVFSLWEGIHWTDQFEGTLETAHWWETFPLSLRWELHSETWSEKTYWKTV